MNSLAGSSSLTFPFDGGIVRTSEDCGVSQALILFPDVGSPDLPPHGRLSWSMDLISALCATYRWPRRGLHFLIKSDLTTLNESIGSTADT